MCVCVFVCVSDYRAVSLCVRRSLNALSFLAFRVLLPRPVSESTAPAHHTHNDDAAHYTPCTLRYRRSTHNALTFFVCASSTRQSNTSSLPLFVLCVRIKGPPNDNVQTSLVVPTGVSEGYSYFPHSDLTLTATGVGLPSIRGHTSTSHLWPRDHQRAPNPHPHLCDATCVTSTPI